MRHTRRLERRSFSLLLTTIVLSLLLSGCGSLAPAVRMLAGSPATAQQGAQVALATAAPLSQAPAVAVGASAAATQPIDIHIAADADVETQIYEAVYRKVNASVVSIENQAQIARTGSGTSADQTIPESSGSGFIWDTAGRIVTNNHVVEGADRLMVTFADGVTLPAELIATDPGSDLAVIQVDPKLVALAPVELGDIAEVQVGARAIAIGNPFGLVGTMTTGIVSAIGRSLASDPQNPASFNIPQVIQTDAAINPGNSGGPLLNERGQVIGVNFQIRSSAGSNSGIGFAIPINIVQRVVPALIKDGAYKHAYLGIRGRTYSPAWADALGMAAEARGAYVIDVVEDGPASRGGLRSASRDTEIVLDIAVSGPVYLQAGGDLITAIDDQPVKTFDDLLIYLENTKSPGDKVVLTVVRSGGDEARVTITLGERPRTTQ
jgi:2-alkenal reductase